MEQQDIKEIIKEWLEEWRNPPENLSNPEDDPETKKDKEKDKGKEKIGEQKKTEPVGEKRPTLQDELTMHLRKKRKAYREPYDPKLNSTDNEHVATSVQECLEGLMTTIVTSHNAMKTALDLRIVELKTMLERIAQMSTTAARPSASETPWGGSTLEGWTRFVCIFPTSVRLPSRIPIEKTGFIELNLIDILIETLQIVQVQVQEELREREISTYKKNEKLIKDNDQL